MIGLIWAVLGLTPVFGKDLPSPAAITTPCEDGDRECWNAHLGWAQTGFQLIPFGVTAGAYEAADQPFQRMALPFAVQGDVSLFRYDSHPGDVRILTFEVLNLPDNGGVRLKFNIADSEVTFFCRGLYDGKLNPPFVSLLSACKADAVVGVGVDVGHFQVDTGTGRWVARWGEVNFIFNALFNGHGAAYLHQRLNFFAGVSADTIWPKRAPGDIEGNRTRFRGNLGVTGMLRTKDNRWEMRGYAGFRPAFIAWDDWAIEARAKFMYNFLIGDNALAKVGLDASYSHWNQPSSSFGQFASDRQRNSFYLGVMFGTNIGLQ